MITLAIDTTGVLHAAMLAAKENALKDPRFLWYSGIFVAVLLFGALVLALVERWRKRQFADPAGEKDPLGHYREMYRKGELSKEEYVKIRDKLAAQYLDIGAKPSDEAGTGARKRPDGGDGSAPGGQSGPPAQA